MSSSNNAYTYQRPSTAATRTLVSDSGKPTSDSGVLPTASSNQVDLSHSKSTHQGQGHSTDNYSQAVAAASAGRPGLDRQQSWSMSDKKRQVAEQMLQGAQGHNAQGYATTSTAGQ